MGRFEQSGDMDDTSMGEIRIDLQKKAYSSGEEVSGTVHISLDDAVSQRSATLFLIGKERTAVAYTVQVRSGMHTFGHRGTGFRRHGSGGLHTTRTSTERRTAVEEYVFLQQGSELALPTDEKGKFKPGEYDIPFRFIIPEGLPTTYRGRHTKIWYEIKAKIDVPLGFDINNAVELDVSSGPRSLQSGPLNASSDSWHDPGSAGINFTLERCQYGRGEVLSGTCAFRNPESKNVRKVDVALKWVETARAQGHGVATDVYEVVAEVPIEGRLAKGENRFSVQIPQGAPPTYNSSISSVSCVLCTKLDIAWAGDVEAKGAVDIVGSAGTESPLPPKYAETGSDTVKGVPERAYPPRYAPTRGIWCSHCGAAAKNPEASYCAKCGSRLHEGAREMARPPVLKQEEARKRAPSGTMGVEDCVVCRRDLGQDEDVVWCPHCGKLAHRQHLIEWIRSKNSCPACGKSLSEEDYE